MRRSLRRIQISVCIASLFLSIIVPSLARQLVAPVGVRAIALGETFVAVADDASVITWNPAGASRSRHYFMGSMYSKTFGLLQNSYLSGILPLREDIALGLDWRWLGFSDEEINFSRNMVNGSCSYSPFELLSVGVNFKGLHMGVSLDGRDQGSATGWGTDWGILVSLPFFKSLQLGLMAQDVLGYSGKKGLSNGTYIKHSEGPWEKIFSTHYKLGVAYRYKDKGLIAIDIDDRIHTGFEISPHPIGAIQVGIQRDLRVDESPTYSIGGVLRYKGLEFSSAYVIPPALEDTFLFALSYNLEYKRPIQIEYIKLNPIYPAHYNYYRKDREPSVKGEASIILLKDKERPEIKSEEAYSLQTNDVIGRVWLKNTGKRKVENVDVYIFAEDYMANPVIVGRQGLTFKPEQRISIPILKLEFMADKILRDKIETITVEVSVKTGVEASDVEDKLTLNFKVYGRNHIGTKEIAALGSFISSEDKIVRDFASQIIQKWQTEWEGGLRVDVRNLPENVKQAMLLFNALSEVTYVSDPNILTMDIVDEIKYPAEMLMKLAEQRENHRREPIGDCDDSTVLLCSLFEAVGIDTGLIKVPGHLFMTFNTGITKDEAVERMGTDDVFIDISTTTADENAWIPLETTNFKAGFAQAWQDGVKIYNEGSEAFTNSTDKKLDFIPTADACRIYPPANVSVPGPPPDLPDSRELRAKITTDLNHQWIQKISQNKE